MKWDQLESKQLKMGRVENVKSMAEKKNVTDKNQKHERNLENSAKKLTP